MRPHYMNPQQMGDAPCIRGMRMPVVTALRMVADGMATEEILSNHPEWEIEDRHEAVVFPAVR